MSIKISDNDDSYGSQSVVYKYEKIKDRLKPNINKISTQEEETAEYYVN